MQFILSLKVLPNAGDRPNWIDCRNAHQNLNDELCTCHIRILDEAWISNLVAQPSLHSYLW